MGKWLLVLGLLGLAFAQPTAKSAAKPPPRPPPKQDQQKLARGLFSNDPAEMDSLADQYDAIGLKETARELRHHAADLRTKPPAAAPPPVSWPIPAPIPEPSPVSPQAPPSPDLVNPSACVPPMQGAELVMVPQCRYRARLNLSGIQCLGGESDIAGELEKEGFRDVRVYVRASALPADWPAAERVPVDGFAHCTRWAEGSWGGSLGLEKRPRPGFVVSMWLAV